MALDMVKCVAAAAAIRGTLINLEGAIAALPEGPRRTHLARLAKLHHGILEKAAAEFAEMTDSDVTTFSGGGDKD